MTAAPVDGRAFFEHQQQRRRQAQFRLTGQPLPDNTPTDPSAAKEKPTPAPQTPTASPARPKIAPAAAPTPTTVPAAKKKTAPSPQIPPEDSPAKNASQTTPDKPAATPTSPIKATPPTTLSATPTTDKTTNVNANTPVAGPTPKKSTARRPATATPRTPSTTTPPAETTAHPAPRPRMVVTSGANAGRTIGLPAGESIIGRQDGVAIVLNDPTVSKSHARLRLVDESVTIEDLGSTNQTLVNGKIIVRETPLKPGDQIDIGAVQLTLESERI
jgi:pSer/pThr/pTyr-binding forkhead associated (FHA) protein